MVMTNEKHCVASVCKADICIWYISLADKGCRDLENHASSNKHVARLHLLYVDIIEIKT